MIRLFNTSIAPATFLLLISESLILLVAFVLATLAVGNLDPVDYLLYTSGSIALLLGVASFLLGLHFQDLYTRIRVTSRVLLLQQLCLATGIAFLIQGLISYLDSDLGVPVQIMLLGSGIAIPSIFLWRLVCTNFAGRMMPRTRLLMIGRSPTLAQLRVWIEEHPDMGLIVEGSAETLDEMSELDEILRKQLPPQLVFGACGKPDPRLIQAVMALRLAGHDVETAEACYERVCGRLSFYSLRPEHLVCSSVFPMLPQRSFYQLLLNGLVAGICLVVVIPLLILTALLLRAANRGPVWRSESLTGLNGRVFQAYRFEAIGLGPMARLVRKLRLERLPQFLNVLKGELAIVGPRAERPEYEEAIERHIPFYRERYAVRPGMTGWAQVNLDHRPEIEDTMAKLEYDLYYIKQMSLGLDTLILLHTVKSMLMLSPVPGPGCGQRLDAREEFRAAALQK
jgi:lipopolysaccharide/colanic/teichoic acid biosynthesis glycosyltransferase